MKKQWRQSSFYIAATVAALAAAPGFAQSVDTARIDAGGQNDWLTYHGSYRSYYYSPLAQINASNVANLGVARIPIPGRSTRGWPTAGSTTPAPIAAPLRSMVPPAK